MSKKSLAVAQCLIDMARAANRPTATPMKLLKLVYIAHGYMLGRHGKPLLEEPVMAYVYGPVVPSIYHVVRHLGSSPVFGLPEGIEVGGPLLADELAVIEEVLHMYGGFDAVTLSDAMHQPGTPWSFTWGIREKKAPISNDLIRHFYESLLTAKEHNSL
jgi:uncharacterized phage-associated protein